MKTFEQEQAEDRALEARYTAWERLLFRHVPGLTRGRSGAEFPSELMMEYNAPGVYIKFMSDGGTDDAPNGAALAAWLKLKKVKGARQMTERGFSFTPRAFACVEAILRAAERKRLSTARR